MDTTQEQLIAALVRRLEGHKPAHQTSRPARARQEEPAVAREQEPEGDVLIDLADGEVIALD